LELFTNVIHLLKENPYEIDWYILSANSGIFEEFNKREHIKNIRDYNIR
jgi:hypothetical protein